MSASVAADRTDPRRAALYKGIETRHLEMSEYDRLRLQHGLHLQAMNNQLISVPLPKHQPVRILDSATCDGTWIKDVSLQYPQATLVGTDINETHFTQIPDLPPQITFRIQSVLEEWPSADHEAYDLIHQRYCLAMFSPEKDAAIVKRLLGLVRPGGFIQFVDINLMGFDGGGAGNPGMEELKRFVQKAFVETGMNPIPALQIKTWLEGAGAIDVKEQPLSFPVGVLAETEELRIDTSVIFSSMIDGFAAMGSRTPNYWYSPDQFQALKEAVLNDLVSKGNKWPFYVVTGRKP